MTVTFDYPRLALRHVSAAALLAICSACGGGSSSEAPPVAPLIGTQPANIVVGAGAAATFTVAATGSAPLSYQWKRNGADIAGATGSSYTLPAALLSDTRSKLSVSVRNAAGVAASNDASLHVTGIGVFAGDVEASGKVDGPVKSARFSTPGGLAFDKAGNLLVLDNDNRALRKVTTAGEVSTVYAGFEWSAYGLAVDNAGNAFVLDSQKVKKVSPAGVASTFATVPGCNGRGSGRCVPTAITVDAANNVYLASNVATRKMAPDGSYVLLEGTEGGDYWGTNPMASKAMAFDGKSSVYQVGGLVRRIDSAGNFSTVAGTDVRLPWHTGGAAVDGAGNLYFSGPDDHTLHRMTPAGVITTVAGVSDKPGVLLGALPGGLVNPMGVATDANGDVYLASGHAILKIQLPPN